MLKDVQAQKDERNIALKHVGIRNLRWPIVLADREKGTQPTVATVSLAVDLPREQRGTHMSRFVECLKQVGPIRPFELEQVLGRSEAEAGGPEGHAAVRLSLFHHEKGSRQRH
jgi:GTP cyclohydrolase IB